MIIISHSKFTMMKKVILIAILAFFQFYSFSQDCLPEGIEFTTQEEIDNFQMNYPGCTVIEGNVWISGEGNISNLYGLDVLTSVGGMLNILHNPSLESLSGLENIETIGGILRIDDNDLITDLDPLENWINLGVSVTIEDNELLANISALLDKINQSIHITGNPNLVNLHGLDSLKSLIGNLSIANNLSLTSLAGLENLQSISEWFTIEGNHGLTNLNELSNLKYGNVNTLRIINNDGLSNLSGLDNLSGLETLEIMNNGNLQSLFGLHNLYSVSTLKVSGNPLLTDLSEFESLHVIEWTLNIGDQGGTPTPGLVSLTGLENVEVILGGIRINNCPDLIDISALSNVSYMNHHLRIKNNDALTSLSGLENIDAFNADVEIEGNISLIDINGISSIDFSEVSSIYIKGNTMLSTCAVESICNYIVSPGASITIEGNATGCNTQQEVEEACATIGTDENDMPSEITIYPNPAEKEIFISGIGAIENVEVNIYNQVGQMVLFQKIQADKVNVSSLTEGMYILEIVSKKTTIRKRIMIK